MNRLAIIALITLVCVACSGSSDNAHTTATTIVPPPPRQVLRVEKRAANQVPAQPDDPKLKVDPAKPLLIFNLPDGKTFREGEPVVLDFSLANAKLKGDGGEYRVRYIVDDEEMQWIDAHEQLVLTGWTPGKHTIRVRATDKTGAVQSANNVDPAPNGAEGFHEITVTVA